MSHLIVLRHGKTEINKWNEENPRSKRIGGDLESPLLPEGEEGAIQAGQLIHHMRLNIELAVSADHERTVRTRDLSLSQLSQKNIRVGILRSLREINYGEFAGRTELDVRQKHPQFFDDPTLNKWRGDFDQKAPGGENYDDIGERLDNETFPVFAQEPGDILVVSSQHTLRVFLHKVLGLTREETLRLNIPNATPILIERSIPHRLVGDVTLEKLLS